MDKPIELFTLRTLAEALKIPYQEAMQLCNARVLVPDFCTTQAHLFKKDRLSAIKAQLADFGLSKSIRANIAKQKKDK